MKSLGLTNKYIEKLLSQYSSSFKGVFSCNTLPIIHGDFTLISNLSKDTEPGTHFITIIVKNGQVYYFDPIGLPCINKNIKTYLNYYSKQHFYNQIQYQCWDSIFCGFYCILFILLHDLKFSISHFKKLFSINCKENDTTVIQLIKYILSEYNMK